MRKALVFVVVAALAKTSGARADDLPSDRCAATYPERIAAVQSALVRWQAWRAERAKHLSAIEWFDANCHFLSEIERAVRRENNLDAFVCRTKKGRPKGLTAEVMREYGTDMTPGAFIEGPVGDSMMCADRDAAERLSLAIPADLTAAEQLELMCWGRESSSCAAGLAALEKGRASGKIPASRLRRIP